MKIDRKIIEVYQASNEFTAADKSEPRESSGSTRLGVLYLLAIVFVNWTLFFLPFLRGFV